MATHSLKKALRLAQLDKEIMERLVEVGRILEQGDAQGYLYVSNLDQSRGEDSMVAAATGSRDTISVLLYNHGLQSQNVRECLVFAGAQLAIPA